MASSSKRNFPLDFEPQDRERHSENGTIPHQRSNQLPSSYSFLVIDQLNSPATFLITHFICQALKQSRPILLLSGTHTQSHWIGLLQKQGIQLTTELQRNRLKFFNALTPIGASVPSDHLHESSSATTASIQSPLYGLFQSIRDAAAASAYAPLLIIDDLTTLLWSGNSSQDLEIFLKHIRRLQRRLSMTVVNVLHSDLIKSFNKSASSSSTTDQHIMTQEEQEDTHLFHNLSAHSHVILKTRNLGLQGAGELAVLRGPVLLSDYNLPVTLNRELITQYRIQDNTVTYQTKGLDKGFL